MIIYPAIDLIGGAVVRLHKGDFDQLTTYGDDPVSVAQSYADAGASWLHLVDLDGAKNPDNRQIDLIAKIIQQHRPERFKQAAVSALLPMFRPWLMLAPAGL